MGTGRDSAGGVRVPPERLRPAAGELGLLSADPADLARRVTRTWSLFHATLERVDLRAGTRSRGRTARDLLIPVGAWPDSRRIPQMIHDARAGLTQTELRSHADRRLREAHADATGVEILAAVRLARDEVTDWFADSSAAGQARMITPSPLGPVPLGTLLHAVAFHLAVTVRDLRQAGAAPSPELEELGVAALVDSAGAVAARLAARASIAATTDSQVVAAGAADGAWATRMLSADDDPGPGVQAPAGLIVDVAAGRVDFLQVARRFRVHQPRRLSAMSVVLDGIPELPAATMLRRAARITRTLGG